MNKSDRAAMANLCVFVSGACALIYQTVWLREFRLIFGASTAASAAVLGIFMGGLGIGGAWLGARCERVRNPLRWYGSLELLISIGAALTPALLWGARQVYFALGGSLALGIPLATVVRLVLSGIVLVGPTVLMGGTLPAVALVVASEEDRGRRSLATLYSMNTFGAVCGTLLSTFFLLEHLGNRGTLWTACAVNLGLGLLASFAAEWPDSTTEIGDGGAIVREVPVATPAQEIAADASSARWFVFIAAAAVGFAFMLMELVWYRMLGPILGGSTFTFGLILATALAGIGFGGWLYSLRGPRSGGETFAWTCALEALVLAAPIVCGDWLARLAQALRGLSTLGFLGQIFAWELVCALVVLPASIVAGYQFPLLIALLGAGRVDVGRHTGIAYAWNTAGAIVGSLAGGFGLLPALSAPLVWRGVVILLGGLAGTAIIVAGRANWRNGWPALVAAGIAGLLAVLADGPSAAWRHSGIGAGRGALTGSSLNGQRNSAERLRRISVWEAEGIESSVGLQADASYSFVINGKVDGNIRGDAGTQVMGGLVGCLFREVHAALVIGLGTGSTAGWLGAIPEMRHVDVVELEPAVQEIARRCAPANRDVLHNPKVALRFGDARETLLTGADRYDLIFSEPSNPYRSGIASLFTREFYQAVERRLGKGGVFAQWLQSYEVDGRALRTAYATIGSVFPYVQTWETQKGDMVLVASLEPFAVDIDRLRARIGTEPFRAALQAAWQVNTVEGVLAHLAADTRLCRAIAASGQQAATDDSNGLEFGFARQVGVTGAERLRKQIHDVINARGWNRPPVQGAIDWDTVDRERCAAFSYDPPDLNARVAQGGAVGVRWQLLKLATVGNHEAFRAVWESAKLEPASAYELFLTAKELASVGDPDCWRLVAQIYREEPGVAEALWARALAVIHRQDEAVVHLSRAFELWRDDPWPTPLLVNYSCRFAVDLSRGHREVARKLYTALREPFCVMIENEARLANVFQLAQLAADSASDPILRDALSLYGPHLPWERNVLETRALSIVDPKSEAAIQAAVDLMDFDAAEGGSFFD